MDTNTLILTTITIIASLLNLLGSGLKYSTNNIIETPNPTKLTGKLAPRKVPLLAKPWWVRSVSVVIIMFLLYTLNQLYLSNSAPTTRTVFTINMLFLLLALTLFSYVLFEVSLRASSWVEKVIASSMKLMRSEQKTTLDNLRNDLYNEIKKHSEQLDKLNESMRDVIDRTRTPFELMGIKK